MEVLQFHGKIFYPLTCGPDAGNALESRTLVNNKGKTVPVFRRAALAPEELRPGLSHLLGGGPDAIGTAYLLDRRELLDLPRAGQTVTFRPRSGPPAAVKLQDLGFVVFETGVCFLEMDVSLSGLELEDAMNTTYYLCEPKDRSNCIEYQKVTFDPATKTKSAETLTVSLKDLFLRCCELVPGCGHFEDGPLSSISAKPLLYSYYLLPEQPENCEDLTSNLAQNYKLSYKGLRQEKNEHWTFRNSVWCASANGAASLNWLVGDKTTDSFFTTAFPGKWEREYLFLFLNVIHQKYASLRLLGQLAHTAAGGRDYGAMREELMRGELLQEECERLKLRCFFDLPGRVEHVNEVYRFFQTALQTPRYLASLNRKLQEVTDICRSYTSQIKQLEEKLDQVKAARTEIKITLLAALAACLTFFQSFYTTVRSLLQGDTAQLSLDAVILALTFVGTIGGSLANMIAKRGDIKDLEGQIRALAKKREQDIEP